jgi:5-carboxymethyl-2-hydroxymuconate isomerase
MPHLRIDYSADLEAHARMDTLCKQLATTMASLEGPDGKDVFPKAGTRILAYPAAHAAGHPFIYLNLRITPGRSADTLAVAGDALIDTVSRHFSSIACPIAFGLTLHIDEGVPVYEGRYRN